MVITAKWPSGKEEARKVKQSSNPAELSELFDRYDFRKIFSFDPLPYSTLVQFGPGEIICRIGEIPTSIILLLEGECIASFMTQGGHMHSEMHTYGPNIFGLVGAMWQQPAINDMRTISECLCIFVSVDRCGDLLQKDPVFLNYACRYLARHIRTISQRFDPLPARLARFIFTESKNRLFSYNLTLCSEILGTSPRHLFRVLRDFCDQGVLRRRSKGVYEILDPLLLRDLYNP